MSNVKQADVVSHVALADVLECRTLPRSVAANLEKVAGRDGQVSVDALVDMVVTDHESGGNRKVLRRSVLGITIAMVCLSAVVCGLVFGSVHLTTQMQVQDGVLHARDSADTVMHSGTTVAAFSPSDLKTVDNLQMSSMQTLLFSEEDGTMHMYRVASVSSRPDGEFEVLTMSGEEFVVSAEGSIQVANNGSSSGGRRRLQQDSGGDFSNVVLLGTAVNSNDASSGGVPAMSPAPPGPPGPTTPGTQTPTIDPNPQGGVPGCVLGTNNPCQTDEQCNCNPPGTSVWDQTLNSCLNGECTSSC